MPLIRILFFELKRDIIFLINIIPRLIILPFIPLLLFLIPNIINNILERIRIRINSEVY